MAINPELNKEREKKAAALLFKEGSKHNFPYNRIMELRVAQGMTEDELATTLDIPQSTLNSWENAKQRRMPLGCALAMAELFGVSLNYLLGLPESDELHKLFF